MIAPLVLVLLAGALAVTGVSPDYRLRPGEGTVKTPRAGPEEPDELEFADDVELFALCLQAGLPIDEATRAVADVAGVTTAGHWGRIGPILAVGVPPARAFSELDTVSGFDELARLIRRSADSGAAIAGGCRELAARLRSGATDRAVARAERAGVLISLPLTGCFLPASIVLGLVPVVISLGSDLLPT